MIIARDGMMILASGRSHQLRAEADGWGPQPGGMRGVDHGRLHKCTSDRRARRVCHRHLRKKILPRIINHEDVVQHNDLLFPLNGVFNHGKHTGTT